MKTHTHTRIKKILHEEGQIRMTENRKQFILEEVNEKKGGGEGRGGGNGCSGKVMGKSPAAWWMCNHWRRVAGRKEGRGRKEGWSE